MAATCMMRQTDERHVLGTATIDLMKWSPRRDVIALTTSAGDIVLRRLSWKKVWRIPKKENVAVTSLVWRPDSEVLAVGYSGGEIILVDIETGESVHAITLVKGEISHMKWESYPNQKSEMRDSDVMENLKQCIPPLPPLSSKKNRSAGNFENSDLKKLGNQRELNILWVGTTDTQLHGFIFGIFHVFSCNLGQSFSQGFEPIINIHSQGEPSQLTILTGSEDTATLSLMTVSTPLLGSHAKGLYLLATLYGKITGLIDYIESTIKALQEAWEDGLVDLESKLANYGKSSLREVSLSADLLELLVLGQAPKQLQDFLVNDITDKGLKRMGQAMELSYADMQKLVIEQLTSAGYILSLYMNQLNGLSQQPEKFGVLGLERDKCMASFQSSGSFLAKTSELHSVISSSMNYLKTFFLWLFSNILTLSRETISQELASVSEQDIEFIAKFLNDDFDLIPPSESGVRRLKLERVGQYLRDEPLTKLADSKDLPWTILTQKYPNIGNSCGLFDLKAELSLIQQFSELKRRLDESFSSIPSCVAKSCVFRDRVTRVRIPEMSPIRSSTLFVSKNKMNFSLVGLRDPEGFFIVEIPKEGSDVDGRRRAAFFRTSDVHFGSSQAFQLVDIDFYNTETLSILLSNSRNSVSIFAHLSIDSLRDELLQLNTVDVSRNVVRSTDAGHLIDPSGHRQLTDFPTSSFALNSFKNVAAILSEDRRRIRIFDMEVEEEDEDENDKDMTEDPGADASLNGTGSDAGVNGIAMDIADEL